MVEMFRPAPYLKKMIKIMADVITASHNHTASMDLAENSQINSIFSWDGTPILHLYSKIDIFFVCSTNGTCELLICLNLRKKNTFSWVRRKLIQIIKALVELNFRDFWVCNAKVFSLLMLVNCWYLFLPSFWDSKCV